MKINLFKLHFTTPLHLGDEKADYGTSLRTICSDTMHAALISALVKVGYKLPDDGDPGFDISNLFPFYQQNENSDPTYFFPKPIGKLLPPHHLLNLAKPIKKVNWPDKDYFQQLLMGDDIFNAGFDAGNIKGEYLTRHEVPADFITTQVAPRVAVPRTGMIDGKLQDARPFYMERLYFQDHAGLFFLANGNLELLKAGLEILQHEGLGTDRNVGNGYFTFSEGQLELTLPKSDYACALSLFSPENKQQADEMISAGSAAYNFRRRGGWITTAPFNALRKNSIFMFTEGSILKTGSFDKFAIKGKIADLTPVAPHVVIDHKIFRNGKAVFIPIKI
jgi:CRISPR type III-A-associated RAMP protein Csm4